MKHLFLLLLLNVIITTNALAEIAIDYPGLGSFEDTELPGSPSKEQNDYVVELQAWAKENGITMNLEMATSLIIKPMSSGYTSKVYNTVNNTDDTGATVQTIDVTYDPNMPVWHMMRTIIFLETLKKSAQEWESKYINNLAEAGGETSLLAAYERAKDISNEYEIFVEEGFFSGNYNPLVAAIIGSGNTSYGNVLASDGTLETYLEGNVLAALDAGMASQNLSDFVMNVTPGTADVASTAITFMLSYYQAQGGDPGLTQLLLNAQTATFGALSGGVAMMIAPAQILYQSLNYIGSGFLGSSQGYHTLMHYFASKHYSNDFLANNGSWINADGIIDFNEITLFPGDIVGFNAATNTNDKILQLLVNHFSGLNNLATKQQAKEAYSYSSNLLMAINLDIDSMKKEVASFAYLQYLKEHQFILSASRSSYSNTFDIAIPNSMLTDSEHGAASSIVWKWAPKNINNYIDLYAIGTQSAIISDTQTNSLTVAIKLDMEQENSLQQDIKVEASIDYSDGFQRFATVSLIRNPQHSSVSISIPNNRLYTGQATTQTISIDGDAPK